MSNTLENIYYTKDHEWVNIDNGIATVGITDYAQNELGDIIFVEFPIIGSKFKIGDVIGTIEAVKTVADLYSPIEGIIMKINSQLEDEPGSINKDPYESNTTYSQSLRWKRFDSSRNSYARPSRRNGICRSN